jgi:hypothetical protein
MCRISKINVDWVAKGCHIHVGPVELAVRPGENGGIVMKKVHWAMAALRKMGI